MIQRGGCGTNISGAAATAAQIQPLADRDPAAAQFVHDCLYFAETESRLFDRDQRSIAAGDHILQTGDASALLQSGWALLNLARTTTIPDFSDPADEARYDAKVVPIARKAMEVLFAAAEAGATGAYEPLGILSMQFGDRLGNDALASRLRDRDNWEWLEEGAARGDWAAQCRIAQSRMNHLRWDGRDYSRDEFDAAVKLARACVDNVETTRAATWHDGPEWLAYQPRRRDHIRPVLEIASTKAELNGLLFFDADRQINATANPGRR
jgi:hypothetical protein